MVWLSGSSSGFLLRLGGWFWSGVCPEVAVRYCLGLQSFEEVAGTGGSTPKDPFMRFTHMAESWLWLLRPWALVHRAP